MSGKTAVAIMSMVVLFGLGCPLRRSTPAPASENVEPNEAGQVKTVVLTWSGHRAWDDDVEEAVYYLDGIEIGRGSVGFDRFLSAVERLPAGSTVVLRWEQPPVGSTGPYRRPFSQRFPELVQIVRQRGLELESDPIVAGGGHRKPRTVAD